MSIDIEKVQEAICIPNFKRTDLLEIALTHPSRIYENYNNRQQQDKQERDYRRLAILGDTILGTTIIDYLYQKYPDFNQQKITDVKSQMVSRKTCYKFAKKLNLKYLCVLGGSERLQEENKQIELLAEMFEALFGAIYLHYDRKFSLASDWLIKHFIKDAVDEFLKSNQISEELPVDYSETISSMNVDESSKLLWQMKEDADALVEKNLLIIHCLNESKLAPEVKQDIEETLFLPTQSDNI
ncbi:ribonuclease III domain-containing protein [Nostoc sp.]|uniref:ribonuclease III domain-containing protein n=1 Tax=Nostoc sp. TaxID=1180 RepID=UPI002FFBF66A